MPWSNFWTGYGMEMLHQVLLQAVGDEVTKIPGWVRQNHARRDIKALSRQIERWGMHSLLLTERPRRMYRYPLPVLACLFRCCHRIQDSLLSPPHRSRIVSMMATEDFHRSLARLGFQGAEIRKIDEWLIGPATAYPNAWAALQTVQKLGLGPDMTLEQRQATLRVVQEDAVPEAPAHPDQTASRPRVR